ncbi:MAG: MoaD/ThiS family protein [Bacteroidia bacterium]
MKVLVFGELTDIIKSDSIEIEASNDRDELLKKIYLKFPVFQRIKFRLAVNNSLVDSNIKLSHLDEIALLPAFAGG